MPRLTIHSWSRGSKSSATSAPAEDALDGGVADVALMPQRHVLEGGQRIAPHEAGQAGDLLAADRVPLVRHGRAALLLLAERLLGLAHLGLLQRADLGGERLQAGGED